MLPIPFETAAFMVAGIFNAIFALFIFLKGDRTAPNKLLILILLNLAAWSWAHVYAVSVTNADIALIATRVLYAIAAIIPYTFLLFASLFLNEKKQKHFAPLAIPALIIVFLTIFSNSIIKDVEFRDGVDVSIFGSLYIFFALYLGLYFFAGIAILFKKLLSVPKSSLQRQQIKFVLIGAIIAISVSFLTNVALLYLADNFSYRWLGPVSTITMGALFTYAIFKHHLFNVRVITTEVFTAFIIIVVFLDALLSSSFSELIFRGGIFAAVSVFGIFLIRGTLREIRELERLSEEKSTFVSIASHQLRAPLTAIKGFISMIREGSGDEEDKVSWLRKAYISNERLIRIVNDLLDISRIERGKIQYNFKDISILKLLDSIVGEFKAQDSDENVKLIYEKPEKPLPPINADTDKLRQVFTNLIDNSLKYTESGWVKIKVDNLQNLGKIRVTIQDTGIGMHKEDLDKIFHLFSRGEGGQKLSAEGTGLGLYVASEIVKAHKGRIWAESEGEGKGSRFIVELPI